MDDYQHKQLSATLSLDIGPQGKRRYWAVLIGIDDYAPDGIRNLHGCVRDVQAVSRWLQSTLPLPQEQMTQLTAEVGSLQHAEIQPTYENVMAAFDKLGREANPGDFVFIHYSGHGSRAPTLRRDVKTTTGLDEVLVLRGGRHLRDFELGEVLDNLAGKGLIVLVVLDCCHSGGVDRDELQVRGIDRLPGHENILENVPAGAIERGLGLTRDAAFQDSLWQKARNYTVLAACQPHEKAREIRRKGKSHGLLTYSMLESLQMLGGAERPVSYQMLQNHIRARMHVEYNTTLKHLGMNYNPQHPMILGEQDRIIFGNDAFRGAQVAGVVDVQGERVHIDIGAPHGVISGDRFAVYNRESPFLVGQEAGQTPVSHVTIESVTGSHAVGVMEPVDKDRVKPGCWVKLVQRAPSNEVPVRIESPQLYRQLLALFNQTEGELGAFLRLIAWDDSEATPVYEVHDQELAYETTFASGQRVPNVPSVSKFDGLAEQMIQKNLQQLARYHIVQSLHNDRSPIGQLFRFRVSTSTQHDPTDTIIVDEDDFVNISFENNSPQTLYLTVFNLTPQWSVIQLTPPLGNDPIGVEAGRKDGTLYVQMTVPKALREAGEVEIEDTLMAIVTTEPTQLWMLQTDGIMNEEASELRGHETALVGASSQLLQELLASLGSFRNAQLGAGLDDWQTAKVKIVTRARQLPLEIV
ncbi:caspase domain-containing protein [Aspergillus foveolatus]|uniref:caspase domain-containing protein n=1 Tax=Aspergillus foveolatus TaxID=210207 RepID=UPI003CCE5120